MSVVSCAKYLQTTFNRSINQHTIALVTNRPLHNPTDNSMELWQDGLTAPQAAWTSFLVVGLAQWLWIVWYRWQRKVNFHICWITWWLATRILQQLLTLNQVGNIYQLCSCPLWNSIWGVPVRKVCTTLEFSHHFLGAVQFDVISGTSYLGLKLGCAAVGAMKVPPSVCWWM